MPAARSVRRLSIRAPDDALAQRAGFLIEDALRTASLPGDDAGLVLVRRLRLPAFSASASPQQVARALEASCFPIVATLAGASDDSSLAAAEAVRFADALVAHQALTRLILAGAPRQAWCWPLGIPGYRPTLATGPALRAVALSVARLPEAPAALPRWLAGVIETAASDRAVTAFLAALADSDMALLAQAIESAAKQDLARDLARWAQVFEHSSAMFGEHSPRHRWLVRAGASCGVAVTAVRCPPADPARHSRKTASAQGDTADRPVPQGVPEPGAARVGTRVGARVGTHELSDGEGERRIPASRAPAEPPVEAPLEAIPARRPRAPRDRPTAAPMVATASTPADYGGEAATRPPDPRRAAGEQLAAEPGTQAAARTCAGGLLFLLPVLEGLGLRDWLAEHETRAGTPRQLLALILQRLDIATEDPAWQLCGEARGDEAAMHADLRLWLRRCRRALRLRVGVGLYDLVCRPARLQLTDTHAEVFFALDAVDLRLRRAGLDLDPGWVPWFSRVVRFHYGRDAT